MMDDYATCENTYSTLCLYHDQASPEDATKVLGITPDRSCLKGEKPTELSAPLPKTYWALSSEGKVPSKDTRTHLIWLAEALENKENALEELRSQGWTMRVSSYWRSYSGHGGPMISPALMRQFADFGIGLEWDVYFVSDHGDSECDLEEDL